MADLSAFRISEIDSHCIRLKQEVLYSKNYWLNPKGTILANDDVTYLTELSSKSAPYLHHPVLCDMTTNLVQFYLDYKMCIDNWTGRNHTTRTT